MSRMGPGLLLAGMLWTMPAVAAQIPYVDDLAVADVDLGAGTLTLTWTLQNPGNYSSTICAIRGGNAATLQPADWDTLHALPTLPAPTAGLSQSITVTAAQLGPVVLQEGVAVSFLMQIQYSNGDIFAGVEEGTGNATYSNVATAVPDGTVPADVDDLQVDPAVVPLELTLRFSEPADYVGGPPPGGQAKMADHIVVVASLQPVDASNFDTAPHKVIVTAQGFNPPTPHLARFASLAAGSTYHFAVRAYDASGNASPLLDPGAVAAGQTIEPAPSSSSGSESGCGSSADGGGWTIGIVAMLLFAAAARSRASAAAGLLVLCAPAWSQSWTELGGSSTGGGISTSAEVSVGAVLAAGPQGRVAVAWIEARPIEGYCLYVKSWNGSAWLGLAGSATGGGITSPTPGKASSGSLAYTPSGHLVLAFSAAGEVYVKVFDGSAWIEHAGSGSGGGLSQSIYSSLGPSVAVDASGAILVAWAESGNIYLKRWDGATWTTMGGSASHSGIAPAAQAGKCSEVSLALDPQGRPVVAWSAPAGQDKQIYVRRWDVPTQTWVGLGGSDVQGGISAISVSETWHPSLRVDSQGRPLVTWMTEHVDYRSTVYLRRWNPGTGAWEELAGSGSGNGIGVGFGFTNLVAHPSLELDAEDDPIVTWSQHLGSESHVHIRRWNPHAQAWFDMIGSTGTGIGAGLVVSQLPVIAVDRAANDVYVAWQEQVSPTNYEFYLSAWHNAAPTLSALQQFRVNGVTPIPPGGLTYGEPGFVASCAAADADADAMFLDVEFAVVGIAPTGTPTASSVSGTGPAFTLPVSGGLVLGERYHWSARLRDAFGKASPWTPFGSGDIQETDFFVRFNQRPTLGTCGQRRADGGPLPVGESMLGDEPVVMTAWGDDSDGDPLRLDVEIRSVGTGFSDQPTGAGATTAAGSTATVAEMLFDGQYHWQCRVTDLYGESSSWVPFGGNAELDADFSILPIGSTGSAQACSGSASPFFVLPIVALLAAVLRRRR